MAAYFCAHCGREHDGIPAFHADRPALYWDVPEEKRSTDVFLTSDSCVIADRFFFVRGCLEVPINGHDDVFTWGVWVSLKEENFFVWQDNYENPKRSHLGPFFGWLCTELPVYPNTLHLKTDVCLRDDGVRPRIEVHECEHPLAIDFHQGIDLQRALGFVHELSDTNLE